MFFQWMGNGLFPNRLWPIEMDRLSTSTRLFFNAELNSISIGEHKAISEAKPCIERGISGRGNMGSNLVILGNTIITKEAGIALVRRDESDPDLLVSKPEAKDAFLRKEKYIQSKYVEKRFVIKEATECGMPSNATRIWEAVKTDNLQEVYRLIVTSDVNINTNYDEVDGSDLYHSIVPPKSKDTCPDAADGKQYDPTCSRIKGSGEPANCMQGCSLLHLACHVGDIVMLELLLQFGADINIQDFHGRTPLHHSISKRNNSFAKYLLRRGARASIKDCGGLTVLERAMEMGAITDEKLFILLTKSE